MNCNTTNMDCRTRVVTIGGEPRTFVAGGAVDQYFTFGAMIAFTWGGSERAADAAEEAPAPPKRKRKKAADDEESAPEAGGDE